MNLPNINARAVGITTALVGIASMLIWKFGDLLELMFTPDIAADIVRKAVVVCAWLLILAAAIVLGWSVTGSFRDLWLDPVVGDDGKKTWTHEERRLKACSFVWTTVACFIMLSLRFRYDASDRVHAAEQLFYYFVASAICGRASVPLYDVVAKRWWPRFLRYHFPTKVVDTPTGPVVRDADEPSGPGEKTRLPDRTVPRE